MKNKSNIEFDRQFKNFEHIQNLKNIILENLKPVINNDFILLDVPNHRNIGDSLIWHGELIFFKHLTHKLKGQYNADTFDFSMSLSTNTVILLHGGGNFGDLYRKFQSFRLKVIDKYPLNRIIILPQTIYYDNSYLLEEDLKLMNLHKDLYICVRDKASLDLIQPLFESSRIFLLPDMAFFLDFSSFHNNLNQKRKVLFLRRTDKELFYDEHSNNVNFEIKDWPSYSNNRLVNFFLNKFDSIESKLSYFLKYLPLSKYFIDDAYGLKSRKGMVNLTNKGIDFFYHYDVIYTSRLHGLILGVLLNKEVHIIDNIYGKNSNFYNTWLKSFERIYWSQK